MPTTRQPRLMGLSNRITSRTRKTQSQEKPEKEAFQRILDRAEYELKTDPYRGMMTMENGIVDAACPWKSCQYISNIEGEEDEDTARRKVFKTAHCACRSLIAWTEKHDETQRRKRNKRKRKSPVETELDLLGKRPENSQTDFACDYNPFCLASVGGAMDELLGQTAAKVLDKKKSEIENGEPFLQNEVIHVDDDEHSSRKPEAKKARLSPVEAAHKQTEQLSLDPNDPSMYSQVTTGQLKEARRPCEVAYASVRAYVEGYLLPHSPANLTTEIYMTQLRSLHKPRMFFNPLIPNGNQKAGSTIALALPPGIRNLGATCYLNTQLQCLAQNLAFLDGIFSWKPVTDGSTKSSRSLMMNSVLSKLQLLLARMVHGGEATVTAQEFSTALGLENDEMQDPNEFARLLFERMHEAFVNNTGLSGLLPSLFQGMMAYETTCMTCRTVSERKEGFMDINLPIEHPSGASPPAKRTGQLSLTEAFGVQGDTTVQYCLDQYLRAEELSGDNQYFCETCKKKRDAQRVVALHKLPPVLNVQISRYVFDRAKCVKKKLSDKVLLPRVLNVPEKGEGAATKYLLCAVMKHQGTSAYQGHYVAEAMDWHSGTWFEFNDESVTVLDGGPSCSYKSQSNYVSPKKLPPGSKDAYNMYYVRELFLAKTARTNLGYRCKSKNDETPNTSEPTILWTVAKERRDRYSLLKELCENDGRIAERLNRRRQGIVQKLSDALSDPAGGLVFSVSTNSYVHRLLPPVWVDGSALRRFFACQSDTESLAGFAHENVLRHTHHLCEHGAGLHPRIARRGKLLPRPVYEAYAGVIRSELENSEPELPFEDFENDCIISPDQSLYCGECVASYRKELSCKLRIIRQLKKLYEDLAPQSQAITIMDDSSDSDNEEFVYYVSKKFITKFRGVIMRIMKCLEGGEDHSSGAKLEMYGASESICEGVDALDLSQFSCMTRCARDSDSTDNTTTRTNNELDPLINMSITCEHGGLSVTTNKRNVRCVSGDVWMPLKTLFPRAITHKRRKEVLSSAFAHEKYPDHCPYCRNEEVEKEELGTSLCIWAAHTQASHAGSFLKGTRSMEEVLSKLLEEEASDLVCEQDVYLVHLSDAVSFRKAFKSAKFKKDSFETKEYIEDLLFNNSSTESIDSNSTPEASDVNEVVLDRLFQRWCPRPLICTAHGLPCQSALFPADTCLRDSTTGWLSKLGTLVEPLTRAEYLSWIQSIFKLALVIDGQQGDVEGSMSDELERRTIGDRTKSLAKTHHYVIRSPLSLTGLAKKESESIDSISIKHSCDLEVCHDPSCNRSFREEQTLGKAENGDEVLKNKISNLVDMTGTDDSATDDELYFRIYEVETGQSVRDVISSILPDQLSSNEAGESESTFLRRSSRKKKTRYPFGGIVREDMLQIKLHHNLAALRLFIMEKCPDYRIGEKLFLIVPTESKSESVGDDLVDSDYNGCASSKQQRHDVVELPFSWNKKTLEEILKSYVDEENGASRDLLGSTFVCRQKVLDHSEAERRLTGARQQEEAALMDSVFELANTTSGKNDSIGESGSTTKRGTVERGFRGTFLHGSSPESTAVRTSDDIENECQRATPNTNNLRGSCEERTDQIDRQTEAGQGEVMGTTRGIVVCLVDDSDEENINSKGIEQRKPAEKMKARVELLPPIESVSGAADVDSPIADAPFRRSQKDLGVLNDLIKCLSGSDVQIHDAECRKAVKWARETNPNGTAHQNLVDISFAKYLEGMRS